MAPPGRNEKCPCNSGKKYKFCCGLRQRGIDPPLTSRDSAVRISLDWLRTRYKKKFTEALQRTLIGSLSPDELVAFGDLQMDEFEIVELNVHELVLAEGWLDVKGEMTKITDLLLSAKGPHFEPAERRWIEQLGSRPLGIYDVTEVVEGEHMVLCDSSDFDSAPIVVKERSGSRKELLVHKLACRVMELDQDNVLSGAVYAFSHILNTTLDKIMSSEELVDSYDEVTHIPLRSLAIYEFWVKGLLGMALTPRIMDNSTGEPMELITDYYKVKDWESLDSLLISQEDVEGNRSQGWTKIVEGSDGMQRSAASINIDDEKDHISVFYRTRKLAIAGKEWFETLVGDAVEYEASEVQDMTNLSLRGTRREKKQEETDDFAQSPEYFEVLETYIRKLYANWADEPLPVLGNKTPRQSIKSNQGLQRVKGLLRSYQQGENSQAANDSREAISYQFLWDALGIKQEEK